MPDAIKDDFTDPPISLRVVIPVMARPLLPVGLMAVLLALVTMALYWPVTGFDFTNWDDPDFVTSNVHVQGGLNWAGCEMGLSTVWGRLLAPADMAFVDVRREPLWSEAGGYHFTNVAFHAANSALVFVLLRLLTGALWRSVVVAALFALHPLRVESVAWVTERKDVLSGSLVCWRCYFTPATRKRADRVQNAEGGRQKAELKYRRESKVAFNPVLHSAFFLPPSILFPCSSSPAA